MAERQCPVENLGKLTEEKGNQSEERERKRQMKKKEVLDFYRGKKILITGHTGFKGSWLSEILLLAGARVTGYSLNPPTEPSLFELLGLSERMNSVTGDVRDLRHMKQVFEETQPEIVLHLAAQPIVLSLIHI